jgi:hypothetical protein
MFETFLIIPKKRKKKLRQKKEKKITIVKNLNICGKFIHIGNDVEVNLIVIRNGYPRQKKKSKRY